MHSDTSRPRRFANPWIWAGFGATLTLVAWLGSWGGLGDLPRSALVVAGLFLLGVAAALRLHSGRPADLGNSPLRSALTLVLVLFQVGLAALFSWVLVAAVLGMDP